MAPNQKFSDFYEMGDLVSPTSCGAAGEVKVCSCRKDREEFAVKAIWKAADGLEGVEQIKVMECVGGSDRIVKLVDWFEDEKMIYIVMGLARGGDLFDRISKQRRLSEKEAAIALHQILSGVLHIHSKGIVHADLKPENILYDSQDPNSIRIADFGFAQFVGGDKMKHCGTNLYAAPEILEGKNFGSMADMWSCGVILYALLAGGAPFQSTAVDRSGLAPEAMRKNKINFGYALFDTVSPAGKDLIKELLVYDADKRLTAATALEHRWFAEQLPPPVDSKSQSIG